MDTKCAVDSNMWEIKCTRPKISMSGFRWVHSSALASLWKMNWQWASKEEKKCSCSSSRIDLRSLIVKMSFGNPKSLCSSALRQSVQHNFFLMPLGDEWIWIQYLWFHLIVHPKRVYLGEESQHWIFKRNILTIFVMARLVSAPVMRSFMCNGRIKFWNFTVK